MQLILQEQEASGRNVQRRNRFTPEYEIRRTLDPASPCPSCELRSTSAECVPYFPTLYTRQQRTQCAVSGLDCSLMSPVFSNCVDSRGARSGDLRGPRLAHSHT